MWRHTQQIAKSEGTRMTATFKQRDAAKLRHQQAALYAARVRARAWMRDNGVRLLCTDRVRWKLQPQLWLLDSNANPF